MRSQEQAGLILVVEDNRNISEMVGEYLESRGFEVDYAEIRSAELGRLARARNRKRVALIAARLGLTRLIDNIEFDSP